MIRHHTDAEILSFLRSNPMAVISTIHKGREAPEAALVAFCETDNFNFIFQTFSDARKYHNIKENSKVAFVVGWDIKKENQITFQYEGVATELSGEEYKKYRGIFEAKNTPCKAEWLDKEKSKLFIVKPRWFGYSDYSGEVPRITERSFN